MPTLGHCNNLIGRSRFVSKSNQSHSLEVVINGALKRGVSQGSVYEMMLTTRHAHNPLRTALHDAHKDGSETFAKAIEPLLLSSRCPSLPSKHSAQKV